MEILSANGAQRFGLSPTRIYDPVTGRFLQNEPILSRRTLAHYPYSANNPVIVVDPSGAIGIIPWTTPAHEDLIDKAFPNTSIDLNILKAASEEQDNWRTGGQSAERAYQHGMMAPDQTVLKAKIASENYIKAQIVDASEKWCAGDKKGALEDLGKGLHTVMDSFSPMHRDAQGNPLLWQGMQHEVLVGVGTGLNTATVGGAVGTLGGPIGIAVGFTGGFVVGGGMAAIPTVQHVLGETLDVLNQNPKLKQEILDAMRDAYNKFRDRVSRKCPGNDCPALGKP